ncbi:MAG: methyltransferase domain-containing protein [Patescibacteria group bacterium]|nr:methyltransferase domain-containing protein [Patescibacteria group bacterium]
MEKSNSQKIIEKTRDDYDLIAKEWDLSRNRASKLKTDLISDINLGDKVLDIGCGNALMAPFILDKGALYFGLDISEKLIDIAKDKYKKEVKNGKASFFVGQATELPFGDKEFNYVISYAVFHHIPSKKLQEKFFQEIKRVSKPNAKVKIIVWNLLSDWANERFDIENQLAGEKSGDVIVPWKATYGKVVERYLYQFSKEELLSLVKTVGFKNIKIDYFTRAGEWKENAEELVLEME